MSVNSEENKSLLLSILQDHPGYKSNRGDLKDRLFKVIEYVHKERFRFNNNLTVMNKEILRNLQTMIPQPTVSDPNVDPGWGTHIQDGRVISKDEVPKLKIFEERLKEKQDDFNNLIKAEVPKEIDFSDKTEDRPIITDSTIDQTMQQRQEELRKIMSSYQPDKKAAEAWLNGEAQRPEGYKKDASPLNSIIKKETKSDEKKRVTFKIEEAPIQTGNSYPLKTDTESLFNKLKLKTAGVPKSTQVDTVDNASYSKLLEKIIENQQLILEELRKLNSKDDHVPTATSVEK